MLFTFYLMKKDILRFQVSMDNVVIVHIFNRMTDLSNDIFDFIFWEATIDFKLWVEIGRMTEFEHKIDISIFNKDAVELDDVGMIKKALYFDFPHELNKLIIFVVIYFLWDLFDGTEEACFAMPCKKNTSEFAFF